MFQSNQYTNCGNLKKSGLGKQPVLTLWCGQVGPSFPALATPRKPTSKDTCCSLGRAATGLVTWPDEEGCGGDLHQWGGTPHMPPTAPLAGECIKQMSRARRRPLSSHWKLKPTFGSHTKAAGEETDRRELQNWKKKAGVKWENRERYGKKTPDTFQLVSSNLAGKSMGPLSQGLQAVRSTLHPRISDVRRNRQVSPSPWSCRVSAVSRMLQTWAGDGEAQVWSPASIWAWRGRRRCIITLNGLLLQRRSSSLVLANEKLLAGFQREACTRGTFASVALSGSWTEFI